MSPLSRIIIMNTILSSRKKNRRKTRIKLPPTEHLRGMQLPRCSFSTYDQPKNYLVISYGEDGRKFIFVPIDTLIPPHTNPITFSLSLDDHHTLDVFMSCILVGEETLYFFGGINTSQQLVKKVYRSDLSNLSAFMETGKITYCSSMRCGTYIPLLFKVDDDLIVSSFLEGRTYTVLASTLVITSHYRSTLLRKTLGVLSSTTTTTWANKNILLGAHYAETGRRIPVVAFLLDDNLTSVVKSQPLYLTLPDKKSIAFSGRLVDLGRDGYFGYTHFYPVDETDDDEKIYGWNTLLYLIIELVVFKLIRLQQGLGPDE